MRARRNDFLTLESPSTEAIAKMNDKQIVVKPFDPGDFMARVSKLIWLKDQRNAGNQEK